MLTMKIYYFCNSVTPSIDYWMLNEFKQKNIPVILVDISDVFIPHLKHMDEKNEKCDFDYVLSEPSELIDFCHTIDKRDVAFVPTIAGLMKEVRYVLTSNDVKVVCDTSFGLPLVERNAAHVKKKNKVKKLALLVKDKGFLSSMAKLIKIRIERLKRKVLVKKNDEGTRARNINRNRKLRENLHLIVSGRKSHYGFRIVNNALNHIKIGHPSVKLESATKENTKYIVFIDQAIPFHRDAKRKGYDYEEYADAYYKDVVGFLDRVKECHPDCEVVVALHPRSEHNNANYGDIRCIKGETMSLILKSKFVITHYSTAIFTAVYHRKPIIFLRTPLIDIHHDSIYLDEFSKLTGANILREDSEVPSDINVNKDRYESFIEDFIFQSDARDDINSIDVILDKISK